MHPADARRTFSRLPRDAGVSMSTGNRLLKKAHLLRCAHIASLQRMSKYASARRFFRGPCIWAFLNSLESRFSTAWKELT